MVGPSWSKGIAIAGASLLTVSVLSIGQVRYQQEQASLAVDGVDGPESTDRTPTESRASSPTAAGTFDAGSDSPSEDPSAADSPGSAPGGRGSTSAATPQGSPSASTPTSSPSDSPSPTSSAGPTSPTEPYPHFGLVTQGVTPDSVEIGVTYNVSGCGDSGTLAAMAGTAVVGDPQQAFEAFHRYINETGGIGGRRLDLYTADDGSGGCPEKTQAAAIEVTDQEKVFLVVPGINDVSDYVASKKVPLYGGRDDPASVERLAPNGLALLAAMQPTFRIWSSFGEHYLDSPNEVPCLIHPDAADWNGYEEILVAEAAKSHFAFKTIVRYGTEVQTAQQEAGAAVNKLKSEGCNQVYYMDWNGIAAVFLTSAATTNNYHPDVYTFTSYSALMDFELSGRLMDQTQWDRAIGLSARVPPGEHPAEGQCRDIYVHYYGNDGMQDSAAVTLACNAVLVTSEMMRRGVAKYGDLNADTWLLGADAITNDFYFDAHVPLDWRIPGPSGPFKTKGQTEFTVVEWSSARSVYTFPDYPMYWREFGPNKSGGRDLRPYWADWQRLPIPN